MDWIPVGAIHELPLQHIEDVQDGQVAVRAIDELPHPRKERAFFLLPVPPSALTVGELQSFAKLTLPQIALTDTMP